MNGSFLREPDRPSNNKSVNSVRQQIKLAIECTAASDAHHCNGGTRMHDNDLFSKHVGGQLPHTDIPSRRGTHVNIESSGYVGSRELARQCGVEECVIAARESPTGIARQGIFCQLVVSNSVSSGSDLSRTMGE